MSAILLGCGLLSIGVTVAIIVILAWESWGFFQEVSPLEFAFGTRWSPILEPRSFGVLPLVCGTFLVAAGALVVAVPIGLGAALYLSEYAPSSLRAVAKPVLEILAGVPTVVFGYFALTFITPYVLRPLVPQTEVFNALSGALVVGIMIVPTICSLCDDAFRSVPRSLREASFALAATRMETSLRVVLPAAFSGVVASVLLGLGRAVGETMAVTLAAGMTPKLTLNPLVSIQTMTSYIVQVCFGDTPAGSTVYQTIFGVGMMLFLITLLINVIAQRVMRRFREAYD
ncbi:MAG: phosphate ABC transporter permease subunit PstC [Planctomycetota bacterium]